MRPRKHERSLRQLLKGAAGYENQLTSSTLALFSLIQVSLPTEEQLVACPDLSSVVPWCWKYLEGDHERMLRGGDEYERIARDTPVEPCTGPLLECNHRQYLRLTRKLDRLHVLWWALHHQERASIFLAIKKNSMIWMILDARSTNQRCCQPPRVALAAAQTLSQISPVA